MLVKCMSAHDLSASSMITCFVPRPGFPGHPMWHRCMPLDAHSRIKPKHKLADGSSIRLWSGRSTCSRRTGVSIPTSPSPSPATTSSRPPPRSRRCISNLPHAPRASTGLPDSARAQMSSETLRYNLLARVDWIQKLVSDKSTGSTHAIDAISSVTIFRLHSCFLLLTLVRIHSPPPCTCISPNSVHRFINASPQPPDPTHSYASTTTSACPRRCARRWCLTPRSSGWSRPCSWPSSPCSGGAPRSVGIPPASESPPSAALRLTSPRRTRSVVRLCVTAVCTRGTGKAMLCRIEASTRNCML
jgi:hypothetical protein